MNLQASAVPLVLIDQVTRNHRPETAEGFGRRKTFSGLNRAVGETMAKPSFAIYKPKTAESFIGFLKVSKVSRTKQSLGFYSLQPL